MNIKALPISELMKKNEDIYEKVVVASKRTRQVIDSRFDMFDAFKEDIEDSEELTYLDEDVDYDLEKAITVSIRELLNDELEWEYHTDSEDDDLYTEYQQLVRATMCLNPIENEDIGKNISNIVNINDVVNK